MRKSIFRSVIFLILSCVLVIIAVMAYFLRIRASSDELVDYFAVAIAVCFAVTVIFLVTANLIARKLTEKIVKSLDNIGFDGVNITLYDELLPYASKIMGQKQKYNDRIAELSERAYTIKAITGNMQEGMILVDRHGLVLVANKTARDVFGDKIESKNITHICREGAFRRAVKKCNSGKNAEIKMERGAKVYKVYFSPVFFDKGVSRGSVILLHDATDEFMAEKQRREFSANVSHELKTPLTTITALSEMIAQGMVREEDIKGFAGRITEQSGRLLALIDDIIRLSEFDEGRIIKDTTSFDLWELTEAVINSHRENAGDIEIHLTGERFEISANQRMIDELLYNLIDNGIKYNTEKGKVTVDLSRTEDSMCKINVSDTGIGINKEHHRHVFERFYRVDKSRSAKTGGTGLGLSIVKHITEHHNGNLELESTEGNGTTVTCFLRG
jgi:two-component system phosphate regulon sensor histidine kinase PhoR